MQPIWTPENNNSKKTSRIQKPIIAKMQQTTSNIAQEDQYNSSEYKKMDTSKSCQKPSKSSAGSINQ